MFTDVCAPTNHDLSLWRIACFSRLSSKDALPLLLPDPRLRTHETEINVSHFETGMREIQYPCQRTEINVSHFETGMRELQCPLVCWGA